MTEQAIEPRAIGQPLSRQSFVLGSNPLIFVW